MNKVPLRQQCQIVLYKYGFYKLCSVHEAERYDDHEYYKWVGKLRLEYVAVANRNHWPINEFAVHRLLQEDIDLRPAYDAKYQLVPDDGHRRWYGVLGRLLENSRQLIQARFDFGYDRINLTYVVFMSK